eukprot:904464-Amorphochlora_amoeboformis.AAC.1
MSRPPAPQRYLHHPAPKAAPSVRSTSLRPNCTLCSRKFFAFRRQGWCRICGVGSVCRSCLAHVSVSPQYGLVLQTFRLKPSQKCLFPRGKIWACRRCFDIECGQFRDIIRSMALDQEWVPGRKGSDVGVEVNMGVFGELVETMQPEEEPKARITRVLHRDLASSQLKMLFHSIVEGRAKPKILNRRINLSGSSEAKPNPNLKPKPGHRIILISITSGPGASC